MGKDKKQHYIPQCYLRLFSDDQKHIWTFDKKREVSTLRLSLMFVRKMIFIQYRRNMLSQMKEYLLCLWKKTFLRIGMSRNFPNTYRQ